MADQRGSESTEDAPHSDEWRDLLAAVSGYQGAAPWRRLHDWPPIGVRDAAGGETGYCSVLGANGTVFGLMVFRGPEGLWGYERIAAIANRSPLDLRAVLLTTPLLEMTLGSRGQVTPADREVFKGLGMRFRGQTAWPVLRSHRPGYLPWRLTGAEGRLLTVALRAVTEASSDARAQALLHEAANRVAGAGGPRRVVTLAPAPTGAWGAEWDEVEPRPGLPADTSYDAARVRRLRERSVRRMGAWQIDLLPAPFGIGAAGRRLEASWVGLVVDDATGLTVHMDIFPARERLRPSALLLDAGEAVGACPARLLACRQDVIDGLAPIASALGCRLTTRSDLPRTTALFNAMMSSRQR